MSSFQPLSILLNIFVLILSSILKLYNLTKYVICCRCCLKIDKNNNQEKDLLDHEDFQEEEENENFPDLKNSARLKIIKVKYAFGENDDQRVPFLTKAQDNVNSNVEISANTGVLVLSKIFFYIKSTLFYYSLL